MSPDSSKGTEFPAEFSDCPGTFRFALSGIRIIGLIGLYNSIQHSGRVTQLRVEVGNSYETLDRARFPVHRRKRIPPAPNDALDARQPVLNEMRNLQT